MTLKSLLKKTRDKVFPYRTGWIRVFKRDQLDRRYWQLEDFVVNSTVKSSDSIVLMPKQT